MAARLAEPDCRDDDDHIYQLLGELMRLELAMLDGTPRARHEYVVLTLTQALTKMRPSDRILRALR